MERTWYQRAFDHPGPPPVFEEETGCRLGPDRGTDEALAAWRREIARGREVCAGRSLDDLGRIPEDGPPGGLEVSSRRVHVHMIEEYARHSGHADILRERTDGVTGA